MGRAKGRVPRLWLVALVLACSWTAAPARAADPFAAGSSDQGRLYASIGDWEVLRYGGLNLHLLDGPAAGRAWSADYWGGSPFASVSQEPATWDGDVRSQRTVYVARSGDTDLVRVTQTTRVRDGAAALRVTYTVQNLGAEPLRFRAAAVGEVVREGTGVHRTAGERRFVAVRDPGSGLESGLEQVTASRLSGDAAPVPVAAWTARRTGYWYSVLTAPAREEGIGQWLESGAGVGAEWTDHATAALPAGASERYEVVWRFRVPPPLALSADRPSRFVGATSTITATSGDDAGQAAPGRLIRWRVAGANAKSERLARTGADGTVALSYTGTAAGADVVTAYADLDEDGTRDPEEPLQSTDVTWSPPPPRLTVYSYGDRQVGRGYAVDVAVLDAIGEPQAGANLRWNLEGRNALADAGRAQVDTGGRAHFVLVPRYAGPDVITLWIDEDADGGRDADEPAHAIQVEWAPPPPPIQLSRYSEPQPAGEPAYLSVSLYDEFGIPRADTAVRWSVSGVTDLPERTARTGSWGEVWLSYTAPRSGTDTVTAWADLDGDGIRDADEDAVSTTVRWQQAPPPPSTFTTIDGESMDVRVSSRGAVVATRRDSRGLCDVCDGGLVVRFTGGPLAGKTYSDIGHEPFFGDAQGAVTRDGDTLTQVSTYRIRFDDVDHVRVKQTTSYTEGGSGFRTSFAFEALTDAAHHMRAGVVTALRVGGGTYGPSVRLEGPPRLVGGQHPTSGVAAGLQEVGGSPWERSDAGYRWYLHSAIGSENGLDGEIWTGWDSYGAAVQWAPVALARGAGREYALDWRVEKPPPLHLTPLSAVAETRHEHAVTATLVDDPGEPRDGVPLRWSVSGANPTDGERTAVTAGLGQARIAWTGTNVGRDTLTVYEDVDGDGARGDGEPQRVVTVDWRQETAVDPPEFDPLVAPNGAQVPVALQGEGNGRFVGLTPSQASLFPTCADGSPKVGLRLRVNVDPAAGQVVGGSMTLRTIDASHPDLEQPIDSIPPAGEAVENTYAFVIECLRPVTLYLCYTLEELGLPAETFCVLLGGLGLYDPSGVVYDRRVYDTEIAEGQSAEAARAAAALPGAEVRLQRRHDGVFRQVLSGDPFVTPNVNPYVTGRDGRFGWAVSPGTYRVVVSARGYETATSRAVDIPPPELALDVALVPEGYDPKSPPPEPEPEPEPTATPSPQPTATATPVATPTPQPTAVPTPEPTPEATPEPTAEPTPEPTAEPDPQPAPELASRGESAGVPVPAPPPPGDVPRAAPPPRPVAPAPRIASARVTASRLDRRGRLRLTLRCPAGEDRCSGVYRLTAIRGGRALGSVRFSVAPGAKASRVLRLAPAARTALRASRGKVRISAAGAATVVRIRGAD